MISLGLIPLQRILILRLMIVPEPIHLAHHRPDRGKQESGPDVVVDAGLFVIRGSEAVGAVVVAEDVVHAGHGFPRDDACVWVLEGGNAAIGVDFGELWPFEAVGGVAELPEFDLVGDL